ncbi:MAG: hypothetical protein WA908_01385 [Pontixanthobacter sp.]
MIKNIKLFVDGAPIEGIASASLPDTLPAPQKRTLPADLEFSMSWKLGWVDYWKLCAIVHDI